MKLALLIPYTPDREQLLNRVLFQINEQIKDHPVYVITNSSKLHKEGGPTTGQKRNELLDAARNINASHVAFIDSDDLISHRYIDAVMPGVYGDYDCCELWGQYYENGKQLNPFHHSVIHKEWHQDAKFYYRNPNHLNVIKLELLKDIRFKDQTIGEDGHFSIALNESQVLKKQYPINEILYYYFSGGRKDHKLEPILAKRRGISLH